MIPKKLKKLIVSEALALRKHLTPTEKKKIKYRNIIYRSQTHCIYGLATGNCFSDRAIELLNKCAVPYSDSILDYKKPVKRKSPFKGIRTYSPIEFYICQEKAKVKCLVNLIKS